MTTIDDKGIYSPEQLKRIHSVSKNVSAEVILKFIDEHADGLGVDYARNRNHIAIQDSHHTYDVLLLDNELMIHYSNGSDENNHYYRMRICAFKPTY